MDGVRQSVTFVDGHYELEQLRATLGRQRARHLIIPQQNVNDGFCVLFAARLLPEPGRCVHADQFEWKQPLKHLRAWGTVLVDVGRLMEPKNSLSPEQTGDAGKPRNTQMLEDVEESMPAERYQTNSESAISPVDETENFSLVLSRDEEMERLRSLSILNPEEMDSRIEIPTAPTKNPKSETMISSPDDAELLKDLRGLGKPPLFDGNDTDVSFFPVSEDDSILLRHMDDVVDTGPDEHHRAIGEIDNQMNQHIDMPQNQHTDKVADESVAVQRQVSQRTTETKAPEHQWDDRSGVGAEKDVQGEAITKYCWSEGKKTVSICKQRIFKLMAWRTRSQASKLPRRKENRRFP